MVKINLVVDSKMRRLLLVIMLLNVVFGAISVASLTYWSAPLENVVLGLAPLTMINTGILALIIGGNKEGMWEWLIKK